MKTPRYILRESVILRALNAFAARHFLELGFGSANLLVTLARLGYHGDAFDFSPAAALEAQKKIRRFHVEDHIRILDEEPDHAEYELILFFEVIGYWPDPVASLEKLKRLLKKDGAIVFSFTNIKHHGRAEEKTGRMKCFSRKEIQEILAKAGFRPVQIYNYGFPLSNILRPFLHLYHHVRPITQDAAGEVKSSGLPPRSRLIAGIAALGEIVTRPFCGIQWFFRNSDLGTGYVVVAQNV